MSNRVRLLLVFLCGLSILAASAFSQNDEDKSQRPSPPAQAHCTFADGKTISVDYSSPRMRGRRIFGGLVPWNEVWRAGANEATTFVINGGMVVGGKNVPGGHYTLFTLPTPNQWTLIVSRQTGEWGIPYPGEQYDFVRTHMNVSKLSAPLQNFLISFSQTPSTCTMKLAWDTTQASVDITPKK